MSLVSTKIPFKGAGKEYIGDDVEEMVLAVKHAIQACCVQVCGEGVEGLGRGADGVGGQARNLGLLRSGAWEQGVQRHGEGGGAATHRRRNHTGHSRF